MTNNTKSTTISKSMYNDVASMLRDDDGAAKGKGTRTRQKRSEKRQMTSDLKNYKNIDWDDWCASNV